MVYNDLTTDPGQGQDRGHHHRGRHPLEEEGGDPGHGHDLDQVLVPDHPHQGEGGQGQGHEVQHHPVWCK